LVQQGLATKPKRLAENPSIALDLDHHTVGPMTDAREIGGIHYHETQICGSLGLGLSELASSIDEEIEISSKAMRKAGIPEDNIYKSSVDAKAFYLERTEARNSVIRDCC
jgi:hypothetical protein